MIPRLVLILLIICGLRFTNLCSSAYSAVLTGAYENYLRGDFQETIVQAQNWINTEEGLYIVGTSYAKLGEYKKARWYYRELLKNYPQSLRYECALVKLADTYFLAGDFEKARALYVDILTRYPAINYAPTVYLRLAQVASKDGRWHDKREYLKFIKTKYRGCVEMQYVKIMEKYGDYFTIQVGAFGKEENAQKVKMDLENKCAVYLTQEHKPQFTLYRVRVGKFSNRKEAETTAEWLLNQGYPAKIYP